MATERDPAPDLLWRSSRWRADIKRVPARVSRPQACGVRSSAWPEFASTCAPGCRSPYATAMTIRCAPIRGMHRRCMPRIATARARRAPASAV